MTDSNIKKSFLILAGGNLVGKVLGFCRELLLAGTWGTSYVVSAYYVAQSAILISINLLIGETLVAGFVPLLRKTIGQDKRKAYILQWTVFFILLLIAALLFVLVFFHASFIISKLSPGFDEKSSKMAIVFLKVFSLSIPLYLLGQFMDCREMANGRFFLQSARPGIQSVGMMTGIGLTFLFDDVSMLAWGFVGAYLLYMFLGLFRLLKQTTGNFDGIPGLPELTGSFKVYLKHVYPLLFFPLFMQGYLWIEKAVASMINTDTIAALSYAKYISETGQNLLVIPLGFISLSILGGMDEKGAKEWIGDKICLILLLTVPISIALFVHADKVITIIYARGAFSAESVTRTSDILRFIGIGLWVQLCGYLLMKSLNARLKNLWFISTSITALVIQAVFCLVFYTYGGWILGAALSLAGVIQVTAGITLFKIHKKVLPILILMLAGGTAYYFAGEFVPGLKSGYVLSAVFFVVFWPVWIYCIPPLRKELIFWLKRGISK